jgi:hypothetical protein
MIAVVLLGNTIVDTFFQKKNIIPVHDKDRVARRK